MPDERNITIEARCEASEWILDAAQSLVYLDGEEGRDVTEAVEGTGTHQTAFGNTVYLDVLSGGYSQVYLRIHDTRTVKAPTDKEMQDLLDDAAVKVSCTTKPSEHTAGQYARLDGSFSPACSFPFKMSSRIWRYRQAYSGCLPRSDRS